MTRLLVSLVASGCFVLMLPVAGAAASVPAESLPSEPEPAATAPPIVHPAAVYPAVVYPGLVYPGFAPKTVTVPFGTAMLYEDLLYGDDSTRQIVIDRGTRELRVATPRTPVATSVSCTIYQGDNGYYQAQSFGPSRWASDPVLRIPAGALRSAPANGNLGVSCSSVVSSSPIGGDEKGWYVSWSLQLGSTGSTTAVLVENPSTLASVQRIEIALPTIPVAIRPGDRLEIVGPPGTWREDGIEPEILPFVREQGTNDPNVRLENPVVSADGARFAGTIPFSAVSFFGLAEGQASFSTNSFRPPSAAAPRLSSRIEWRSPLDLQPVPTTTSIAVPSRYTIGGDGIRVLARVNAPVGVFPNGRMQFFVDGRMVGSVEVRINRDPVTYWLPKLPAGIHSVRAEYSGFGLTGASVSATKQVLVIR